MGITPEICPHCGQAVGIEDYDDLWRRFLKLKSALVRCNTSLNIFEVAKISSEALNWENENR